MSACQANSISTSISISIFEHERPQTRTPFERERPVFFDGGCTLQFSHERHKSFYILSSQIFQAGFARHRWIGVSFLCKILKTIRNCSHQAFRRRWLYPNANQSLMLLQPIWLVDGSTCEFLSSTSFKKTSASSLQLKNNQSKSIITLTSPPPPPHRPLYYLLLLFQQIIA